MGNCGSRGGIGRSVPLKSFPPPADRRPDLKIPVPAEEPQALVRVGALPAPLSGTWKSERDNQPDEAPSIETDRDSEEKSHG